MGADCFNITYPSNGKAVFGEGFYQELAANMVSTPVMLAAVMATMASLSWVEEEPAMSDTGQAHGDSVSESGDSSEKSVCGSAAENSALAEAAEAKGTGAADDKPQKPRAVWCDPVAQRLAEAACVRAADPSEYGIFKPMVYEPTWDPSDYSLIEPTGIRANVAGYGPCLWAVSMEMSDTARHCECTGLAQGVARCVRAWFAFR